MKTFVAARCRAALSLPVLCFGLLPVCPARVLAQCASWNPLTNLSQSVSSGRYDVDSSVAVDANGTAHVVFQDFLDSSGRNYYTTNVGGSWSAPYQLSSMSGKGATPQIVIATDPQTQVQTLYAFFGKGTLYCSSKPVSGGSWSAPIQVSGWSGSFIQGVTVDSAGGIYFMYGHLFDDSAPARNGIYGRYKPLNGSWSGDELIYGNGQDGNWPNGSQVIADGTTLWMTIDVDDKMYYKKKTAGGVWSSGKGTQFSSSGAGLRFAFDPTSSEIVATYVVSLDCAGSCEDSPWFELYSRFSYDDGANWSSPFNISDMVDDIDRVQLPVYDSKGNLHVLWEGFCCDHKLRMRYRSRIAGGWRSIQTMSSLVGGHVPVSSLVSHGMDLYCTFSNSGTGYGEYDVMFTSYTADQPRMHLSQSSFTHTVNIGGTIPNDTFTLVNGCYGAFNYTITDNSFWLNEAPSSGSSTGEFDTITLSYPGVSALHAGVYNDAVTVSGNANNSPQTVAVTVTVQTVKPDLDGDGDVELNDYAMLQGCFTGSLETVDPPCASADFNGDHHVDGLDLAVFTNCITLSNQVANPDCD